MVSRIATITIDAVEPRKVADFWAAALGWQILDDDPDVLTIGPPDGAGPTIDIASVLERKAVKNRLHFDLRADGSSADEEIDRLLKLGARRVDVGQPADVSWTVLADPEGNEFCVLAGSVQEVRADG